MKLTAHKKKEEINLLPKSGFSSTTSGRVMSWLLSTFRIIVIVTEILVMVAFLSRFWLDAQNSDLNEKLEQKKNLLEASQDFENNLADVQNRIKVYSEYSNISISYSDNLDFLTQLLPPDVLLTNLTIATDNLSVRGISPSERGIQQFITNIQLSEGFSSVEINNIQNSEEQNELIIFDITAERTQT